MEEMSQRIGKSIYFTHLFTELVKSKDEKTTFTSLLKLDDEAFLQVKREFHNRLNRLFVHPSLGDALDSGEIDFMIMQILEELVRTSNGTL